MLVAYWSQSNSKNSQEVHQLSTVCRHEKKAAHTGPGMWLFWGKGDWIAKGSMIKGCVYKPEQWQEGGKPLQAISSQSLGDWYLGVPCCLLSVHGASIPSFMSTVYTS